MQTNKSNATGQLSLLESPAMLSAPVRSIPAPPHKIVSSDVASIRIKVRNVTSSQSIKDLIVTYVEFLKSSNKSPHTISSFESDMLGLDNALKSLPVAQISTHELRSYIAALSDLDMAPKTISRKLTSIKNFFRWAKESIPLDHDPSVNIVFERPTSPLPDILTSEECDRFFEAARSVPAEYLIALLLLGAGLKRCEIVALRHEDIDLSNPIAPVALVSMDEERNKVRNVELPIDFTKSYESFMKTRSTTSSSLFNYSERTFNKIIARLKTQARITKSVSCQILRDSYAVRCLAAGETIEAVFKKLGLSEVANEEARLKYQKLAAIDSKN